MERDALLRHLELNDRHIAETRAAIARHEAMMATLERAGGRAAAASELLRHMREVLAIHEAHRERILAAFKDSA